MLEAAEPVGLCLPPDAGTSPSAGGGNALSGLCSPIWGAVDIPCWERGSPVGFGGPIPSPEQWGSSPVSLDPGPRGCGLTPRVPQGHGATGGMSRVGMGSPRCPRPGGSAPAGGAPGPPGAAGAGGGAAPRSSTATRDRGAGPGRLRAVSVAPGLSRTWALRVPAATRRDGPPGPTGDRPPLPGYPGPFHAL